MGRLEGKGTVVTGAASGIGRAAAEEFAAQGAVVFCVDLAREGAQATAAHITESGGKAFAHQADLTSEDAARAMAERAVAELGDIDAVYACAGIAGPGTVTSTTMEDWDRVIAVNLTSKWLSFRYFAPRMVDRGCGSIIVQSSIGGLVGSPGIFPYAAAKSGCFGMVRQAAVELGKYGVRVNGIAPGVIPTPLVTASFPATDGASAHDAHLLALDRARSKVPLGRLGEVEDVAQLATYLASDESKWTTGQVLVVDGGVTAQ